MSAEHLSQTRGWLRDPSLRREIDCLAPPTIEQNKAYWEARWNDPSREDYAILREDREHVGNCGLGSIDSKRRKCELWIYLGCAQGQGIGKAAFRILLARAFDGLNFNRVYLRVVEGNNRALQFYRGFGFTLEGRWREDTVLDGKTVDSLWLSMLATEYRTLAAAVMARGGL
ncbi:MAG: GNAT family protein [Magnetospirillum sp.]|nr:GNAT family protein [Magnetospirillum sp.]